MSSLKKFFGSVFILSGLIYAVWALLGGGIDFYPNLNTLEEGPGMEFLNIMVNLIIVSGLLVLGFSMLMGRKFKGRR